MPSEEPADSGVRVALGSGGRRLPGQASPLSPPTGGRRIVLLRLVGKGGFGEVYEGRIETPGGLTRRVAVKLLRADVVDQDTLARTKDEAHLLSRLSHPMIVSVEDLLYVDERLAIISEYVDGVDLADRMPLETGVALEVIAKVAEALHAAWTASGPDGEPMRIVHRDLKPSNIRLGPHGVVKLLDFGIARPGTGLRRVKTGSGLLIGSLGYVPPERWNGTGEGHASDVYALGCVLLEAMTDEPLFAGLAPVRQLALAGHADNHEGHVQARLDQAGLPADVRALLEEMLAWDAERRPTAMAVARRARRAASAQVGAGLLSWSGTIEVGRSDWSTAHGTVLSETDRGFTVSGIEVGKTELLEELELDETATHGRPRRGSLRLALATAIGVVLLAAAVAIPVAIGVGVAYMAVFGPGQTQEPDPALADASDPAPDVGSEDQPEAAAGGMDDPLIEPPHPEAAPPPMPVPARRPDPVPDLDAEPDPESARLVGELGPEIVVVPASTPEVSAPVPREPASATGSVEVTELSRVRLRSVDGRILPIGSVPVGTYSLEASWDIGTWTTAISEITVHKEQTMRYQCAPRFRRCQVLP